MTHVKTIVRLKRSFDNPERHVQKLEKTALSQRFSSKSILLEDDNALVEGEQIQTKGSNKERTFNGLTE